VGDLEPAGSGLDRAGEGAGLVANNSLASTPDASAAQFTFTISCSRRGLSSWMARAIRSLPVPVSPRIRTVLSVGATCSTARQTFRIEGPLPTRSPAPWAVRISPRR